MTDPNKIKIREQSANRAKQKTNEGIKTNVSMLEQNRMYVNGHEGYSSLGSDVE